MAACVLSLHATYIAWFIFGAFFTRGRSRLAALHLRRWGMARSSKSLVSGARSRRLKSGLRRAAAFHLIAVLSFRTTSMHWYIPTFLRTFSPWAQSPSAF
jgi:hypothetical protein